MKKSNFISFRTDTETKNELQQIAEEKKWTISQTCEILIKEQLSDKFERLYETVLDIIGYELSLDHISEEEADKLNDQVMRAYDAILND